MKVWAVVLYDSESSSTRCICATKELAEREMFKLRDYLVNSWEEAIREQVEFEKLMCTEMPQLMKPAVKRNDSMYSYMINMYSSMIKNLSSDDYTKWENYPHECLCIRETEVITK